MRTKKGFTLIELLVVVSIIALLVSILLPALNKAREQAKAVVCLSNMKSFGTANEVYASTYDGWFVPYTQTPKDPTLYQSGVGERWPNITPFREIVAMQKSIDPEDKWEGDFMFPEELLCPSHKFVTDDGYQDSLFGLFNFRWRLSYGYNTEYWSYVDFSTPGGNGGFPDDKQNHAFKASSIRSASEKLQWIEASSYGARYMWADYEGDLSFWDQFGDDVLLAGKLGIMGFPGYRPWNVRFYTTYRHNNGADTIFFDGHGARLQAEEVFDVNNMAPLTKLSNRAQNQLWDVKWPMAE